MNVQITHQEKKYRADLSHPLDISLPLREGKNNPNCYWADPVKMETISSGSFIGSVKEGGSVNYQKLTITPHGNGTHTECFGHISGQPVTINQTLSTFHFLGELLSLTPEKISSGDAVITLSQLQKKMRYPSADAVIIRTLPNPESKKTQQYSGTNPPYLEAELTEFLSAKGVKHLLVDLPSLDPEADEGKLLAHKAFWNKGGQTQKYGTVTELIFVHDSIPDGFYLLNLQITSLEMDASPSKPVLYKLEEVL